MTAFAAALGVLFADPNLGTSAIYRAGGVSGGGETVRVVRKAPDQMGNFNGGSFVTDTVELDVLISACPDLAKGDQFDVDGEVFEIVGEPARDAGRLLWRANARAL